jgi:murein DD-endopeptidase MepM/ murein hydrolase activator NlpD
VRRLALVAVLGGSAACSLWLGDVETALRARDLMVPVLGVRPDQVPDTFAAPRGGGRRHAALDIPAPRGTPVVSADDGRVLAVRHNRAGGLVVYATDPGRRFVYYYAHLDRHRAGLRAGMPIVRGEVLGTVGTTGNADRAEPHLHCQVTLYPDDARWCDGAPIDPRPCLVRPGRVLRDG